MKIATSTRYEESANTTLINELMDIGFTKNEARAYMELLPLESATASELVKRTGIADSKIYYIMDNLQKKGLIIVQEGVPKKYVAIAPVEALENLQVKFKKEFNQKMQLLDRLVKLLTPRYQENEASLKIAYIVKGKDNIVNQAKRLIAEANTDIILMLPNEEMYHLLKKTLEHVQESVTIMLGFYHKTVLEEPLSIDFQRICCECFFVIIDNKILLTVSNWRSEESYAILTTENTLIEVSSGYFLSPTCEYDNCNSNC